MRTEKEIKNWIAGIEASLSVTAGGYGSPNIHRVRLEGLREALQWVLTDSVAPQEPLSPIELRDLRAILAEHRLKRNGIDYGNKPGRGSGGGNAQFQRQDKNYTDGVTEGRGGGSLGMKPGSDS